MGNRLKNPGDLSANFPYRCFEKEPVPNLEKEYG